MGNTGAWMIDFSKTVPLPQGKTLTHRDDWALGNGEDGYLYGVDSLIKVCQKLYSRVVKYMYMYYGSRHWRSGDLQVNLKRFYKFLLL